MDSAHASPKPFRVLGVRGSVRVEGTPDRRIQAIADLQKGRVARTQLLIAGVSRTQIQWRLRIGRLYAVYPGVYGVGHHVDAELAHEAGALLAGGDRAVLGGASVLAALGAAPKRTAHHPVHIVIPADSDRGRHLPGIVSHRTTTLAPQDVTNKLGLPMTTVERALLDAADTLTEWRLRRTVDEALGLNLTTRPKIGALLKRAGEGRAGAPLLRRLIDPNRPSARTKSRPEAALLAALEAGGAETPHCNVLVPGTHWEADYWFPAAQVVLEFHSFQWHNNPFTFHKDHRKRKQLNRMGIEVMYVIDEDLKADLLATLVSVVQTLTRRTVVREMRAGAAAAAAA